MAFRAKYDTHLKLYSLTSPKTSMSILLLLGEGFDGKVLQVFLPFSQRTHNSIFGSNWVNLYL